MGAALLKQPEKVYKVSSAVFEDSLTEANFSPENKNNKFIHISKSYRIIYKKGISIFRSNINVQSK